MALSSGERSLAAHMHESEQRTKAGQEARMLDIPATSRKYGSSDDLHGRGNGAAFSNALKEATSAHYGLAGPPFIERLLADYDDLPALYSDTCNLPDLAGSDGVESRAAGTFALISMAGEKATEYGLTGWPERGALEVCIDAFHQWRNFRRRGSTETRQILDSVRDFIARHGDSRFSELKSASPKQPVRDRASYWEDKDTGRMFLFNSPALTEAGQGFDMRRVLDALYQRLEDGLANVEAEGVSQNDLSKRQRFTCHSLPAQAAQPPFHPAAHCSCA
jgi:putative DNA primase/helicase